MMADVACVVWCWMVDLWPCHVTRQRTRHLKVIQGHTWWWWCGCLCWTKADDGLVLGGRPLTLSRDMAENKVIQGHTWWWWWWWCERWTKAAAVDGRHGPVLYGRHLTMCVWLCHVTRQRTRHLKVIQGHTWWWWCCCLCWTKAGDGLVLDGRHLTVCLALSRDAAQHLAAESRTKHATATTHSNRNLHLVRESCTWFVIRRVPTGQGKLERVRNLSGQGKVRGNIFLEKSGKWKIGATRCQIFTLNALNSIETWGKTQGI